MYGIAEERGNERCCILLYYQLVCILAALIAAAVVLAYLITVRFMKKYGGIDLSEDVEAYGSPSLRRPLSEGAGRKMKQILIVDDDVHIGDMIEEMLTRRGYGVLRAYSGTEALLILAGKRPDLILLDLMLPGVTGEEVLSSDPGDPGDRDQRKSGGGR